MNVHVKRVYENPSQGDGTRILVDRLWPRGLTKEGAKLDVWLKSIAPSQDLRTWFGHDPAKWQEFRVRYQRELDGNQPALKQLRQYIRSGTVTLVYGAKDEERNNAIVLKAYLERP